MNTIIINSARMTNEMNVEKIGENSRVAKFQVAENTGKKDKTGNYKSNFFFINLYGSNIDYLEKYLAKGGRFDIVGEVENYYDKDKDKSYSSVNVNKINIIDWAKKDKEVEFTGTLPWEEEK